MNHKFSNSLRSLDFSDCRSRRTRRAAIKTKNKNKILKTNGLKRIKSANVYIEI